MSIFFSLLPLISSSFLYLGSSKTLSNLNTLVGKRTMSFKEGRSSCSAKKLCSKAALALILSLGSSARQLKQKQDLILLKSYIYLEYSRFIVNIIIKNITFELSFWHPQKTCVCLFFHLHHSR